jgi:hypothetical protein
MKCDRCPTVWFVDYEANKPEPVTTSVEIRIRHPVDGKVSADKIVKYEVLCDRCVRTVLNYVSSVDRDPDARKKPRAKKKADEPGVDTGRSPVVSNAPEEGTRQRRPPPAQTVTQPAVPVPAEGHKPYAEGHTRSSVPRIPSSQSGS